MTITAMQVCPQVQFIFSAFLFLWDFSSDVQMIKFWSQCSIPKPLKSTTNQKAFEEAQKQPTKQCGQELQIATDQTTKISQNLRGISNQPYNN